MLSLGRPVLMLALCAIVPASAAVTPGQPPAELSALDSVYYTALLSGRDPAAAVRKAQFTAHILQQDLGMTPGAAAADVARFVLRRGGTLCGGG